VSCTRQLQTGHIGNGYFWGVYVVQVSGVVQYAGFISPKLSQCYSCSSRTDLTSLIT